MTTRKALWLVVVPMDGAPRLEEHGATPQANQAIADLVKTGEQGWVFLIDGVRHPISFADATRMNVQGFGHALDEERQLQEGILPGTELYPGNVE